MAKKYNHLKKKARKFREQGLSLDEICDRFKLSKGTVWHWIKDIPLQRAVRPNIEAAKKVNIARYKKLRDEAYQEGKDNYKKLCKDPTFRDFVCMYLGEGYRKNRNCVSIANSNPNIIKLGNKWIKSFSRNKITYHVQYHEDQDINVLKNFWSNVVSVSSEKIQTQRKTNSRKLNGRNWRSEYGVLSIRTGDTYFRSKLQAWMDLLQQDWK